MKIPRANKGFLYIVATPIGNLSDITARALDTLRTVDFVLAEDTRHTQKLLHALGISKKIISLHDYNEIQQCEPILEKLQAGLSAALVSDAGTPLISDPGYHLIRYLQDNEMTMVPIPGPCALISALCVSGLPTDRFIFEGFLPEKKQKRQHALEALKNESRTLIFYEAPHRIQATLEDMVAIFGPNREGVVARELTKAFETITRNSLKELLNFVQTDENQKRGEIVLMVHGEENKPEIAEAFRILKILLQELPLKQATSLAGEITGVPKRVLYEEGLKIKNYN